MPAVLEVLRRLGLSLGHNLYLATYTKSAGSISAYADVEGKDHAGQVFMKKASVDESALTLHGVTITHPDRLVFEEGGITKGDVARYYAAVAPFLLEEIRDRPISLLRCPSGITADCFYQRNLGFGLGTDVHPFVW